MNSARVALIAVLLAATVAFAQTSAPTPDKSAPQTSAASNPSANDAADSADMPPIEGPAQKAPAGPRSPLQQLVDKQFGPSFEVVAQAPLSKIAGSRIEPGTPPWQPLLTGDLDGDGIQDAVIIARNKNSLIGADAYNYKVVDAYNDYFGFGNPVVTVNLNNDDPVHNLVMLIIHGKGKEDWHADVPKAKFVLINVPFEAVSLARSSLKKKTLDAIRVEESDTVSSLVFWNGKQYKYVPGGGSEAW